MGKHQNTFKKHSKWLPESSQDRPWGAPGPSLKATSFFNTFLTRFWLPIGLPLGSLWASILESIFDSFSGTLRKRPRNVFNRILVLFCLHFGSLFGSFSGHLRKVKIELSPTREPHFYCPGRSENQAFFDTFSGTPSGASLSSLLEAKGSILAPFWGPLGTPISLIFPTLFRARFLTPKLYQNGSDLLYQVPLM